MRRETWAETTKCSPHSTKSTYASTAAEPVAPRSDYTDTADIGNLDLGGANHYFARQKSVDNNNDNSVLGKPQVSAGDILQT